jgi:hypothetical protein
MVNGGLGSRSNPGKYVETLMVVAWRALPARHKRVSAAVGKIPDTTSIYSSLSGLRQTFGNRSPRSEHALAGTAVLQVQASTACNQKGSYHV